MKAAVDSSVLFDIVKGAPGAAAAQDLLDFLADCQLDHDPLDMASAMEAARIMREYARNQGPRVRVAPDFLIGAHASQQADALLTTDAGFFQRALAPGEQRKARSMKHQARGSMAWGLGLESCGPGL